MQNPREQEYQRKRRAQFAQIILAMKLERERCCDCGLAVTPETVVIFDFDHRDPADKRFGIADMRDRQPKGGIDTLLTEINKCDLVCANCHRLRTFREQHHLAKRQLQTDQPGLFD